MVNAHVGILFHIKGVCNIMKKELLLGLLLASMLSFGACSAEEMFPLPNGEDIAELLGDIGEGNDETTPTEAPTAAPASEPAKAPADATPVPTEMPADATATPTEVPTKPVTMVNTPPSELSDDLYSFQVSIDGTVYQFPMWYYDFVALGWTYKGDPEANKLNSYQYMAAETWTKDNASVYTKLANLTINSATYSQCMVAGITLDEYSLKDSAWEIILPKGIKYGVSTKDEVIAAYGTPTSTYEGNIYDKLSYSYDTYNEVHLYVYKETGTLDKIEIENMVELEGGNNTVDATVPDIAAKYTAPAAVGEDLYQFNVELEGKLYTLPCPVSELLANGFTINRNNSASEVASGSYNWVELKYNNQTLRSIVQNYADYATIVENCFITSMKSSVNGPDFAMIIPCNITRDMSEADLLEILKNFNYTTQTSSSYTYYTVYHRDGSNLDNFTIVTKDGVVIIIEVDCSDIPQY